MAMTPATTPYTPINADYSNPHLALRVSLDCNIQNREAFRGHSGPSAFGVRDVRKLKADR